MHGIPRAPGHRAYSSKGREAGAVCVECLAVFFSYVGSSLGFLSCNFFPILNPQKQMANIGATPTTGAAIPLYRPRKP